MRRTLVALLFSLIILLGFGSAHASLTVIGTAGYEKGIYNLIYDSDGPNGPITWLDYKRSRNGQANFVAWASSLGSILTITLNPGYTSTIDWTTGWRLPNVAGVWPQFGYNGTTSAGFNITTSEMGHLFYTELGNKGAFDTSGNLRQAADYGLTNKGPFQKLEALTYWANARDPKSIDYWWGFSFQDGCQNTYTGYRYYGLAVHPGEVSAATPAPIPAAIWFFGVGFAGLVAYRRKVEET